jgi:DNA-binding NarL/FixJ family response regulator
VGIVDVRLPPTFTDKGLQAALAARRQTPGLPVLVLSQHVQQLYARELLSDGSGGGWGTCSRTGSWTRTSSWTRYGGWRYRDGPQVISQLLTRSGRDKRLGRLTPREYEVLASMAEGRSNAAIAQRFTVTERAVAKHTSNIFAKLDLPPSDDDNRRVLAVLAYLDRD